MSNINNTIDKIIECIDINNERIANAMEAVNILQEYDNKIIKVLDKVSVIVEQNRQSCNALAVIVVEQRNAIAELHERLKKVENKNKMIGLG